MAQKAGKLLEHAPKTHELRRLEEFYLSNDPKSPRTLEAPQIDLEQTGLNQVDIEYVLCFLPQHLSHLYHIVKFDPYVLSWYSGIIGRVRYGYSGGVIESRNKIIYYTTPPLLSDN